MSRRNRRYLLLVFALVVLATVAALTQERGVLRIPQDLVPIPAESVTLSSRSSLMLPDGTDRALSLTGETLRLSRRDSDPTVELRPSSGRLLGITPQFRAVFLEKSLSISRPKDGKIRLFREGIGEYDAPREASVVTLPETVAEVCDAVLSPDGTQLVWYFYSQYDRPGVAFLRRLSPGLAARFTPREVHEVWRSDAKGGKLVRVAEWTPVQTETRWHAPSFDILQVGWDQSTGALAIGYNNKTYRLPPASRPSP